MTSFIHRFVKTAPKKTRWGQLPLTTKIPLSAAATVFGSSIAALIAALYLQWHQMEQDLVVRAQSLTISISEILRPHLMHRDYWKAYKVLHQLLPNPSSFEDPSIFVTDGAGGVFISNLPLHYPIASTPDRFTWQKFGVHLHPISGRIDASNPILNGQETIGVVYFTASLEPLYSARRKLMGLILTVALGLALTGVAGGIWVTRRMIQPLQLMRDASHLVMQGRYDAIATIRAHDNDEIADLAQSFNTMVLELRQQHEIKQQVFRAERLSAMGQLAAAAAHEIRNPLAGVLACLNTLRHYGADPGVRLRNISIMEAGLHQVQGVVDAMLGGVRLSSGRHPFGPTDLDHTITLAKVAANNNDVALHTTWTGINPWPLPAGMVSQLILNLVRNAVEASPPGSDVHVSLSSEDSEWLQLMVEDHGIGIPDDAKELIFDPFWSSKADGTGLGLWICCRIVEEFGGLILIDSEEERGTRFEIRFPKTELWRFTTESTDDGPPPPLPR